MAFVIEYSTHTLGPYKEGEGATLYDPECRQVMATRDGVIIFDERGNVIESLQAGSEPFRLSSYVIIYPLGEEEEVPQRDSFPEPD